MDLSGKSALVVGAGGLGGPALLVLAAGGVGRLTLVEDDVVETSNLNRQPLFAEADLGARKASAAAARVRSLFPAVRLEAVDARFDAGNAVELVRAADVVVDGSDNFSTKFLANDAALRVRVPLVHGGVLRTTAQLLSIVPAGLAGALMGAEALRLLAGERGAYEGRLFTFEARSGRSRIVLVRKRPGCLACAGTQPLEGTAPVACEVSTSRPGSTP